ncbi:hypothetical protein [Roseibium sp. MMSF_3412]|uniref:hypothetical protein n=1 Tax=Roseibium sp. MMSF_3412 TaxID=3046712 RepID=UPI00273F2CE3|nr:hypothetical protein [Roseibium sp. MMSF_3412]
MKTSLFGVGFALFAAAFSPSSASAETFICESTQTPDGKARYCNFLLFDTSFSRHTQIVLAQGARKRVAINGRYDLFCVLVQNHRGVPDNIALRTKQCKNTHNGREYKVAIREFNLRRGRNGYSTNTAPLVRAVNQW